MPLAPHPASEFSPILVYLRSSCDNLPRIVLALCRSTDALLAHIQSCPVQQVSSFPALFLRCRCRFSDTKLSLHKSLARTPKTSACAHVETPSHLLDSRLATEPSVHLDALSKIVFFSSRTVHIPVCHTSPAPGIALDHTCIPASLTMQLSVPRYAYDPPPTLLLCWRNLHTPQTVWPFLIRYPRNVRYFAYCFRYPPFS